VRSKRLKKTANIVSHRNDIHKFGLVLQSPDVHRNGKMKGDLRPAGSMDKAVSKTCWKGETHSTYNICKNMGFKLGRPDPLQHCMETDCNTILYGIYNSWQHRFQDTWALP